MFARTDTIFPDREEVVSIYHHWSAYPPLLSIIYRNSKYLSIAMRYPIGCSCSERKCSPIGATVSEAGVERSETAVRFVSVDRAP